MSTTTPKLFDVAMARRALSDTNSAEAKMVQAARLAGIQVMPCAHLNNGKPILLISPELYGRLTKEKEESEDV